MVGGGFGAILMVKRITSYLGRLVYKQTFFPCVGKGYFKFTHRLDCRCIALLDSRYVRSIDSFHCQSLKVDRQQFCLFDSILSGGNRNMDAALDNSPML